MKNGSADQEKTKENQEKFTSNLSETTSTMYQWTPSIKIKKSNKSAVKNPAN